MHGTLWAWNILALDLFIYLSLQNIKLYNDKLDWAIYENLNIFFIYLFNTFFLNQFESKTNAKENTKIASKARIKHL